jgi:zinc transport system substrate-binding protein
MIRSQIAALSAPLTFALAGAAAAEAPRVVTDIAPVHALVAQLMKGVGEPELLVPATVSEHGFALRPSQAAALQEAQLVVTVGAGLTPWLDEPLSTLASAAQPVVLTDVAGTVLLPARTVAIFGPRARSWARRREAGGGDRPARLA